MDVTNRLKRVPQSVSVMILALTLVVSWGGLAVTSAQASTTYNPYQPFNGYKVYLSPSSQSNDGCKSYVEKTGMMAVAKSVASSPYVNGTKISKKASQSNLRARGYRVRIGTGTVAGRIADSNSWGADLHIPLHSNAPGGSYSCSSTKSKGKGTMVMYVSSKGKKLATKLKEWVGRRSPGTSDKICTDSKCSGKKLGELRNTKGIAAYAEVEYHTWNKGVNWIRTSEKQWGWVVAAAVDEYLGYPRKK